MVRTRTFSDHQSTSKLAAMRPMEPQRPASVTIQAVQLGIGPRPSQEVTTPAAPAPDIDRRDVRALAEVEKQMIADALRLANGNKSRAAAALGLSRTQLLRRLRRFGLTA